MTHSWLLRVSGIIRKTRPRNDMLHPKKFLDSFVYAFQGVKLAVFERNFRIQVVLGVLAIVFAFLLELASINKIIIILCVALVLGSEAINSSMERLLDFVSPEHREEIRQIKDLMAAAVLIFSITALIIGVWIFGDALLVR